MLKEKPFGIIISSIYFISLPFIFEIISVHINNINSFLETYKNILNFPLVTILATTASIFLGNTLIRYFNDRKEKTEFAVLFIQAIESHISDLSKINLSILGIRQRIIMSGEEDVEIYTEGGEDCKIYKLSLIENKSYDTAFNKIGIFNESEIDLASLYNRYLKESLYLIDIFCRQYFTQIQIVIPITQILGCLCIYQFSLNYSRQYSAKYREKFLEECSYILTLVVETNLFPNYSYSTKSSFISINISDSLIEVLKDIREKYRKIDKAKDTNNRQPVYLFRALINKISPGEIQIGSVYDDEQTEIIMNIILAQETFIKFTSEIPDATLVDDMKTALKSYITKKIEKVEEISEKKITFNEDIDKFIAEKCEYELYIISPWGKDIDSVKMKFSEI